MSRRWSIAAIVVLGLALSAAVLWWELPGIVRWLVVRQLEAATGRRVSVERFDLDLTRGRLGIGGLRVLDREPGLPLAEIDRLDARFQRGSLIRGHLHVYEATVDGARVRIVRTERGELNIADLLSRPPGAGPPAVTVDRLALTAGALALEDRALSPPRTWLAEAITVEASALSTVSPEAQGALRLAATVAGAPLSVDVSSLSLAPLRARARVRVQGVDATLAQLYLPPDVPVVLDRARFTADLTAALDAGRLALDGRGALDDVVLRRQGSDAPLGTVPRLELSIDGAAVAGQATRIGRLEVTGTAILFDQRTSPATQYPIQRLRLSVETPDPAAPARVSFTAARQGGGQLDVEGTARFAPLGAELRARATRIDLAVWDALIPLPGRLSGFAESDLTIAISTSPPGLAARVRGRAAASWLAIADRDQPLIAAQDLQVTGIDAEWPRFRVQRIRAVRPTVAVERDVEGRLALMALVAPAGPSRLDTRAAEAPAGFTVEVGEIVLSGGTVTLDDAAVSPRARLQFSPVSLSARDVAWPGNRPAKVELKAAMPITGTFEATGTATLEVVKVELRARLAGAALGPYQAYVPLAARIGGRLDADVTVSGALEPRVDVGVRGTAGVRELTIGDPDRPLITVARIDMTGLDYKWPTTVAVDRLRVERSWAMVERRADGSFPLAALFRMGASAGPPPAFDVAVRESLLEGGAATVVDGAVTPPVRHQIAGARLEARDVTWPARRPVPLEIQVPMPGGGSVSGRGQLGVGSRSVDVNVVVSGVDVGPAQPYLPMRGRIGGKASGDLQVKMSLEPFAIAAQGKAGLQDVVLGDGDRPLVTAARIETTGVSYTWPATARVDRLAIDQPSVTLERRPDGTLPLLALLTPASAAPGGAQARAAGSARVAVDVAVRETVLSAGSASIVDRVVSPAAQFDLADLQVTARDAAWPARAPIPVRIGATVPGGGSVSAEGQFAADTSRLDVKLSLRDVALATAHPYLPLRGTVTGKAGGDFEVQATLEPLAITARGAASASDLIVSDGARPLVKALRAEVAGIAYTWPAKVQVDRLRVQGSWVAIERGRDGGLTLGSLLAPAKEPSRPVGRPGAASITPASAAVAPEVVVRQSVFEDAAATIVDAGVSPATRMEIANARLSVRDLTWPSGSAATIDLRAPMPGGGTMEASGRLRADATSVDLKLSFQQADLGVLAPYLPLKARVTGKMDGAVVVKGSVSPLAVAVTGDVTLLWVVVADGRRMVAYVKQADLAGIQADWPRRVTMERVRILEPWALVEREADGSIPLLSLIALQEPAAAADRGSGGRAAAPRPPPAIDIGTTIVEEGFIRFVDRTTTPAFVEEISRINSTARRLGTAPDTRSPFTLTGKLTGGAPFDLEGAVGPLLGPLRLEVRGKLTNLALSHLNPYLGQYFGWVARRGALSVTVDYRVENDRLDARNDIVVSSLDIAASRRGEKVRERVGVPVDTLVSLLKDARGEVKMSFPVTGVVSSRTFDFGDAVWEGVRKTVINLLALPVSWVGKIFYTEDARIDTIQIWPVTFEAGSTQVRRDIAGQVERLATFLRDAPGIALMLKPVVTAEDVQVLTREAVKKRLDALTRESGEPAEAAAARLFKERFPDRPAPATLDAIVAELAKAEVLPPDALNALAKSRVELLRRELVARAGVDAARLRVSEGVVPVEASGQGRVEFEIVS